MLNSWSDDDIKNLSYTSRMEEFSHNKVIVKDAKKNEFLWFVIRVSSQCNTLFFIISINIEFSKPFILGSFYVVFSNKYTIYIY